LVLWLARDPLLFHSLGMFIATFLYSLCELAWVDRGGSGKVPLVSALIVAALLLVSMFLFARLIQSLNDLQISNVLRSIGHRGRPGIGDRLGRSDDAGSAHRVPSAGDDIGLATQTIVYHGEPNSIAKLDIARLVAAARRADGVIVLASAVGDTVFDDAPLLTVHGAAAMLDERELLSAV